VGTKLVMIGPVMGSIVLEAKHFSGSLTENNATMTLGPAFGPTTSTFALISA
jgi:hypothetical protein